jgi:hypothetical protein
MDELMAGLSCSIEGILLKSRSRGYRMTKNAHCGLVKNEHDLKTALKSRDEVFGTGESDNRKMVCSHGRL